MTSHKQYDPLEAADLCLDAISWLSNNPRRHITGKPITRKKREVSPDAGMSEDKDVCFCFVGRIAQEACERGDFSFGEHPYKIAAAVLHPLGITTRQAFETNDEILGIERKDGVATTARQFGFKHGWANKRTIAALRQLVRNSPIKHSGENA